ncbi:hypothetical protein L9F63_004271, partial [Diploptera punctata]
MDTKTTAVASKPEEKVEWKLYHKRWFMLFIYVCFQIGNNIQWIQYSIIANLIKKYYNVSESAVEWTSMIFMVSYLPLVFPASHFVEKVGLRWPMIIGTFATAAGACIKIGSVDRDLFWVTFIGQTLVAMAQVFMLSLPPVIAAIWFGEKEVSTACSIGIFGNQISTRLSDSTHMRNRNMNHCFLQHDLLLGQKTHLQPPCTVILT